MTQKSLAGLAIAAVLAVILATWLTSQRQTPTETESGGALVEGLKDQVNSVTRMVINDGDDQVTLERSDVGWGIAERGGYPADISQLRRKLLALSDAELVEPKTSNPDNYATLGVSDVDADDDQNTLVTLEGLDRSVSVIIGKSAQTRGATYVRRSGEDQSWLAQGDLALEANASRWLAKDLIDVQQSRIKRVVIQHPDQGPLEIVKAVSTDPNFAVVAIPEGRELASASAGNAIATALGSLRLDDVQPDPDQDTESQPVDAVETVFETFDGLRIRTRSWEDNDKRYVALSAEFDATLVPPEPVEEVASELVDAATEPEKAEEMIDYVLEGQDDGTDIAAEAEAIQSRVSGWVFEIPSYKYSNLTKTMEDLLKPLETEEGSVE